ncbi:MAG TPA: restriction endonuclease [Syntrophales bacterium]|nr:restriction endonuclease [Syntrophales bacterium]
MEGLLIFLLLMAICFFFIGKTLVKEAGPTAQEVHHPTIGMSDIDKMDGLSFERLVASILKNEGFALIEVTKASGDFGVDVIALRSNCRYAIQVKRASGKVSRRAISDAVAGKKYYSCGAAIVITNSYLSQQSKEFASSVGCGIVDRDVLAEWLIRYQTSNSNRKAEHPANEKFQHDIVSGLISSSQKSEDSDPLGVPPAVLTSIKAYVSVRHHNNFSRQEYYIKKQIEDYKKLRIFCDPDVPEEILKKIIEKVAKDHPADYSTQLFLLKEGADSYTELEGYIPNDMPEEVFSKIKKQLILDHSLDYGAQLIVFKKQTEAYRELTGLTVQEMPDEKIAAIKKQATSQYPINFEMQLYVVKEKIKSFIVRKQHPSRRAKAHS